MSMKAASATISLMNDEARAFCALLKAREKLASVTPLSRDCGALCGRACCLEDEDGLGGMQLFPGEEACYAEMPDGFAVSFDPCCKGVRLLTCQGVCDREDRPLACRIFPLMFVEKDGGVDVALDPRAWPVCPLMPSGITGLKQDFIDRAREAAGLLSREKVLRDWIRRQNGWISHLTRPLWDEGGQNDLAAR